MKRLLLFFIFLAPFFIFGQVLKMNAWYMPDKTTNFPQTMPTYSLIFVGSIDTLYSVTASYTTADDMNQVISDGNYIAYPAVGGGDTSYFDLGSQRITTKTGITSIASDSIVTGATIFRDGQLIRSTGNFEVESTGASVLLDCGGGAGDQINFIGAGSQGILNGQTDTWTFGDNTVADSTVDVHGGMEVDSDILVGGGWAAWTPSYNWFSSGTPGGVTTQARYSVVNNTVEFVLFLYTGNDTGQTIDSLTVTLPITPADINAYVMCSGGYDADSQTDISKAGLFPVIDARSNAAGDRILYILDLNIGDSDNFNIAVQGTYEITGK